MSHHCRPTSRGRLASNLEVDLVPRYQPADEQERLAVDRLEYTRQLLYRCYAMETDFFNDCLQEGPTLAEGFIRLTARSDRFSDFLDFQSKVEDLYQYAFDALLRLRAQHKKLPNEPKLLPNLNEMKPVAAPGANR
jgi:hypothetical protein